MLGTRIALLNAGRLEEVARPDEFLHADSPEVRALSRHIERQPEWPIAYYSMKSGRCRRTFVAGRIAVIAAIAIAAPLAVFNCNARLRRWTLGVVNVIQTVPSLALFGFLIPLPFIGGSENGRQSSHSFTRCSRFFGIWWSEFLVSIPVSGIPQPLLRYDRSADSTDGRSATGAANHPCGNSYRDGHYN